MRSRSGLLFLLGFLVSLAIQAQTNVIDSLTQLLKTRLPDTSRSLVLSKLGGQYMISNPDTALKLSLEGLALAKKANYVNGEAVGLNQTASVLNITGNYPKALEYFLEALKKGESLNNPLRIGSALVNIGSVYYYQGAYRLAINYNQQAKALFENSGERPDFLLITLLNLGDFYEKFNYLDSARIYTQEAYNLAVKSKDIDFTGMALNNMGNIYAKMDQPSISMEFYRSAFTNLRMANDEDALCECCLGIAKLFQQKQMRDSCLYYAHLSLDIARERKFLKRVLSASDFLSDYHRGMHKIDSAFIYLAMSNVVRDSLFNQEKLNQIQNLSLNETLRQQEKSEEAASRNHERLLNIQYTFISIGLIGFTILFLLLSNSIIINEKWIKYLGITGLLFVFEFINIIVHPYIAETTHHSPFGILFLSVMVAAIIVPLHHRAEKIVTHKIVERNKMLRFAAAKRTVSQLRKEFE